MAMIIIQLLFVNRCSQTVMNLIQGKKILLVLSQAWDSEKFWVPMRNWTLGPSDAELRCFKSSLTKHYSLKDKYINATPLM